MTRNPQLTIDDLFERDVLLSASEAVALTLATMDACPSVPADEDILLSSTGHVVCLAASAVSPDDVVRVAALLQRLLRVDEPDAVERRGRVPRGLLVVLARTRRAIDGPPLGRDAFRDALERFAPPDPAVALAAVFWRAARMRRHGFRRVWNPRPSRRHEERRRHGPTPAELRRWLRQAEHELYRLRRPRTHVLGAAALLTALVAVVLSVGGSIVGTPPRRAAVIAAAPVPVTSAPATTPLAPPFAPPAAPSPRPTTRMTREPPVIPPQTRSPARRPRRTVDMVSLPRASWSVVRRLDTRE